MARSATGDIDARNRKYTIAINAATAQRQLGTCLQTSSPLSTPPNPMKNKAGACIGRLSVRPSNPASIITRQQVAVFITRIISTAFLRTQ
jgi:hypothetical protein